MQYEGNIGVVRITPRYAETDQMGFIHHSNHIIWFEAARMQLFSDLGISISDLEKEGFFLPILSIAAEYMSPVFFNESIVVHAALSSKTKTRISISYTVTRGDHVLCNGATSQVFIRASDKKPVPIPKHIYERLSVHSK